VSLGQLGLFNVGTQFAMVLGLVLGGVGLAFTPLFYETIRLENGPHMLARFGLLYISCALGLGLVVSVFSRDAIRLLTQPEFYDAYRVVPILTATQALTAFWHLAVNPLMFKQRTGLLAGLVAVAAAISFGLNLWLVPDFGIIGAALSAMAANVVLNVMVFAVSIRVYRVPYNYGQMALIVTGAIGVYLAAGFVPARDVSVSIAAKAFILALYPALLFRLGVLDKTSLSRIWHWKTNELLDR
jgi:O-antigen/teichoic acid export membrane protein